jgi:hypothetical protein
MYEWYLYPVQANEEQKTKVTHTIKSNSKVSNIQVYKNPALYDKNDSM